jgi:hypothetical protein
MQKGLFVSVGMVVLFFFVTSDGIAEDSKAEDGSPGRPWISAIFHKEGYAVNDDVFSEDDKISFKEAMKKQLDDNWLSDFKGGKYLISVVGWACDLQPRDDSSIRRDSTNAHIAKRRADRVREFLEDLEVDSSLLSSVGYPSRKGQFGEKFRRVEVYVFKRTPGSGGSSVDMSQFITEDKARSLVRSIVDHPQTGYVKMDLFQTWRSGIEDRVKTLEHDVESIANREDVESRPFVQRLYIGSSYHHTFSSTTQNGVELLFSADLRLTDAWSLSPFFGLGYGYVDDDQLRGGETFALGVTNTFFWEYGLRLYAPGFLFRAYDPDRLLLEDTAAREILGTVGGGYCWKLFCFDINLGFGAAKTARDEDINVAFSVMPVIRFFYSFEQKSEEE